MVKYIFALLLLSVALFSCNEKEFPLTDTSEKKMVLTCFLSPESEFHEVSIRWATYNINSETIEDAKVELRDKTGRVVKLGYDNGADNYSIHSDSMPLVSGETYYVTATAQGQIVSSSCTIPYHFDADPQIAWDTTRTDSNRLVWKVRVKWKDEPGRKNVYRVACAVNGQTFDPDNFIFLDFFQSEGKYLFTENEVVDGWIQTTFTANIDYKHFVPSNLAIMVKNVDDPYFRFHQQLQDLGLTLFDIFPEPYRLYTNINGGYGIFCSSTMIVEEFVIF